MSACREMPQYQSMKKVWALKIAGVDDDAIRVSGEGFAPIPRDDLPADIFARGTPSAGDYLVQYDGGYWSWSPQAAFEQGYVAL